MIMESKRFRTEINIHCVYNVPFDSIIQDN